MDGHQGIGQGSVTVLVASPPSLVRYGLRSVLQTLRPGWAVSESDTLEMTLDVLGHYTPDLLLLDVRLPGVNGVNAIRLLAEHMTSPRILVLADGGHRSEILHWLDGGAHGYLTKSAAGSQVVCAIETVLLGGIFAPATLSARPDAGVISAPTQSTATPIAAPLSSPPGSARGVDLTERQRAVLELVLQGYNTKMIARQLNIAVATAKVHLAAIYRLVGARNRSEVIVKTTRDYALPQRSMVREESQTVSIPRQITWTVHEGRDQLRKTESQPKTRRVDEDSRKTVVSAGGRPIVSSA
ncbi:MAG TPA: response regulator transcription factor [Rhodopila sp.]|nr:response regulator transcription factor [Rhodopila sp.]